MSELQPNLNEEGKDLTGKFLSAGEIKHKYAVRLQTILLRNKGKGTGGIPKFLGLYQTIASLYINRYNERGIDALLRDKTRKPGKEPISQEIEICFCQNARPPSGPLWVPSPAFSQVPGPAPVSGLDAFISVLQ
jgi:hypothetical protein